jgi:hypothetical protein
MVDYRKLLTAYINHVGDMEGVTYVVELEDLTSLENAWLLLNVAECSFHAQPRFEVYRQSLIKRSNELFEIETKRQLEEIKNGV